MPFLNLCPREHTIIDLTAKPQHWILIFSPENVFPKPTIGLPNESYIFSGKWKMLFQSCSLKGSENKALFGTTNIQA